MSTIISDLYEVKLTSTKNQLKINEQIEISVKLIDFNGESVTGRNVTISTDNGLFLRNSGSGGLGQTVTFTNIGANGTTVGFVMSGSGVANIVAKIDDKIKASLQIFTEDYTNLLLNTTNAKDTTYLYINKHTRTCILPYFYKGTSLKKGNSTDGYSKPMENSIIPTEYRPLGTVQSNIYRPDVAVYLQADGSMYYRVEEDKNSLGADFTCIFSWTY